MFRIREGFARHDGRAAPPGPGRQVGLLRRCRPDRPEAPAGRRISGRFDVSSCTRAGYRHRGQGSRGQAGFGACGPHPPQGSGRASLLRQKHASDTDRRRQGPRRAKPRPTGTRHRTHSVCFRKSCLEGRSSAPGCGAQRTSLFPVDACRGRHGHGGCAIGLNDRRLFKSTPSAPDGADGFFQGRTRSRVRPACAGAGKPVHPHRREGEAPSPAAEPPQPAPRSG